MVIGQSSEIIPLQEEGNGRYKSDQLNLNNNETYQLKIVTEDGRVYLSDTFPAKQTALIDSLSWQQDSVGVSIYAYAHDPVNQTPYHRWDFIETWQYKTAFQSVFEYVNGQEVVRIPDDQIYYCWGNFHSSDILLTSTANLSKDIISKQLIGVIPNGSEKLSIEYSILVNQYAITSNAYAYWQNLKKNSEQLGTLFDAQPSQLTGNIHCITVPDEPVLGYMGASTVTQKRIFINFTNILQWYYKPYYSDCFTSPQADTVIGPESVYDFEFKPDHLYTLLFPLLGGYDHVAQNYCADCREHGGTNIKPSFWQ